MQERRRFIRFKVPIRVEFSVKANLELSQEGKIVDFSREGAKIFLPPVSLSKEENIELKTYLPNRTTPISFQAQIRWIKIGEEKAELGLKIIHIDPQDKSEILDYAYKLWREKKG